MKNTSPSHLIIDGQLVPFSSGTMHVTTDAWLRGANVFEGLRAYWSPTVSQYRLVDPSAHVERLRSGLRALRLPTDLDLETVLAGAAALVRTFPRGEDLYLRLSVFIESGAYFGLPSKIKHGWCLVGRVEHSTRGLPCATAAIISKWRKYSANTFPMNVKAGGTYLFGRMPRIEAEEAFAQEAILLNEHGNACESPGANLVSVRADTLHTPRPEDGPLDGITLRYISRLATQLGYNFSRSKLTPPDLFASDELFLCGTMGELVPIAHLDSRPIGNGAVGPLTLSLSRLYYEHIAIVPQAESIISTVVL